MFNSKNTTMKTYKYFINGQGAFLNKKFQSIHLTSISGRELFIMRDEIEKNEIIKKYADLHCKIIELTNNEAREFLKISHYQKNQDSSNIMEMIFKANK
jgi:hypothetical protein